MKKSKSKTLRDVLFRVWEIEIGTKGIPFQEYYDAKMDEIINHFKGKLK